MLFAAFIILIILVFIWPRSKYVLLAEILFMLLMFSFLECEGDWLTYESIYRGYQGLDTTRYFEPAFSILMIVCAKIGIPYVWFRLIVCSIYSVLMLKFVQAETEECAKAMAIMMIFPFFVFNAVIRSGIACPLILCAFSTLSKNRSGATTKFIIYVLAATLFHYSSIFFLIFLLAKKKISNTRAIILAAIALIAFILLNFTTIIPDALSMVISRDKTMQWFAVNEGTANITGGICETLVLLASLFMARKSHQVARCNVQILGQEKVRFSMMTEEVSKLMLFLLPLIWLSSPFLRLSYMLFPMIIVSAINAMSVTKKGSFNIASLQLGAALVVVCILFRFYNDLPYIKDGAVFLSEFFNNKFVFA